MTVTDDLAAARERDERAFARLVEPHRRGLHAHCYRMLGSASDADDALQDALLRAWLGLPGFAGRSTLRTWLYRIATNACLRMLERQPRRALVPDAPPSDPTRQPAPPEVDGPWLEPLPDDGVPDGHASPEARYEQRESVELAFTAALQHLPARQRAVLLLRDVLGFAPAEIADALDASPASIYSALQRAHAAVDDRLPARSQQATLRALDDGLLRGVVERYVRAWEDADVPALVALLTDDAVLAMPPRPSWYRGRAAIGTFLATVPLSGAKRFRRVPVAANGQVAFGVYGGEPRATRLPAIAIEILTFDHAARIAAAVSFHDRALFRRFGLPDVLS
jgi:RNA polymerase sigma-70 factor (ECF subfamily)